MMGEGIKPHGSDSAWKTSNNSVEHAEDIYLNHLLATQDVEEGLRAVVEKRKPAWKDR